MEFIVALSNVERNLYRAIAGGPSGKLIPTTSAILLAHSSGNPSHPSKRPKATWSSCATLLGEGGTVRIGERDDMAFEPVRRVGHALFVRLAFLKSVADVGDRQNVARAYSPQCDAPAVDPGSIGAAEVAYADSAGDRSETAVPP